MVLLLIAAVGALSGFYLLLSVVPLYATAAGAGGLGAGLATGAMMLSTVLLELAVPRLAGRLGYRAVMALGLILLGVPAAALAISPGLPLVLAASLARGAGLGIVVVAGVRALVPNFRRPRARAPGAAAGRGRRLGLVEAINEQLRLVKILLPYHESVHVLNLAYNVLTGGTRLGDIECLRRDAAYMKGVGCGPGPRPGHGGGLLPLLHRGRRGGVDGRGQLGAHEAVARPGRDLPGRVAAWIVTTKQGVFCEGEP